jgi:hypothetical protein
VWCATPARMHGSEEAGRVGKMAVGWAVLEDAPAASSGFSYLIRTSTAELFKKYKYFFNFVISKVGRIFFLFFIFHENDKNSSQQTNKTPPPFYSSVKIHTIIKQFFFWEQIYCFRIPLGVWCHWNLSFHQHFY